MNAIPLSVRIARVVVIVIGILMFFIAPLVVLIILSLALPGSALDGMWASKPGSLAFFQSLGIGGILFLAALGAIAIVTGIGLLTRRRWARWVTVVLLGLNALPDLVQAILGKPEVFLAAVPVALLVVYLALPVVGRAFDDPRSDAQDN
jgi:hypothetical protein